MEFSTVFYTVLSTIKHCLLRSKTRHFCIFKQKSKQISTHILGLKKIFSVNFLNTRTCKALNQHKGVRLHRRFLLHLAWTKCSPSVSCQHTFLELEFFQNILETRTFLMHITHRVCFYGIKHCLLRSKTRHFCIFKQKSKQISTHILGLKNFFL